MNKPVRILHLEDNPDDAELIHAMLVSSGLVFETVIARSQQEFVSAIEKGGFDLVISDFSIPSFDGKTALTLLRQKCPESLARHEVLDRRGSPNASPPEK